jgi:LPS-assembly lipoprotein
MKNSTRALLLLTTLTLCACGFHMRGHGKKVTLAFQSVYLKTGGETPFVADLRNAFVTNKIAIGDNPDQATITLEVVSEYSDKQILSLSSAGKVLEFQLNYRVTLYAHDNQLAVWMPEQTIQLTRTLTYDDSQVLAKEQEEATLVKDMRSDAVTQTIQRLSHARPPKPEDATK